MDAPLVSVVIPGYNCARYIRSTLESVLSQKYPRFEVVFVDDGSTDDTREVVAPLLDRIVYHRQANGGLAAARNAGMSLARGDFIAWIDADDLCVADRLLVQVAYLVKNPQIVATGSNFAAFDDEVGIFDPAHAAGYYSQIGANGLGVLFPDVAEFDGLGLDWLPAPLPKSYRVYSGEVWRRIVLGNFIHPPTLMMRKESRERAGWESLGMNGAEDWGYIIRLAKLGPLAFIDDALLEYRYHPGQMSLPTSATVGPLGNIAVVESVMVDSAIRSDEQLCRELTHKLAVLHADAAYALAEVDPVQALRHLKEAWKSPSNRKQLAPLLARIAMPRVGFRLIRALRARNPSAPYRRNLRV